LGSVILSATADAVLVTTISLALLTPPAAAQDLELVGIVRDFSSSHSDFGVPATLTGTGHHVANLDLVLGADGRPDFKGGGFEVGDEWLDGSSQPIAPHLFSTAGVTRIPVSSPTPPVGGMFDTWNSGMGAYGHPNVGPAPTFDVGGQMPPVVVPTWLEKLPNKGDLAFSGNTLLYDNIHCDKLDLGGTIQIDGDVRILCEGLLHMGTHTVIELLPGASLRIYLRAGSSSWNHAEVNINTGDPSRVVIYNMSTVDLMIHNHAEVYAQIISPDAALTLGNHGALFGTFAGKTINSDNQSDFHLDTAPKQDYCGAYLLDTAGTIAALGDGGIASADTFDEWYRDVLGTNLSCRYPIVLTDNGSGVYEYHDDEFYPIDSRLLGNEGDAHNNYFTYALEYRFTYKPCTGQFFSFEGTDDAWVFIGDVLAIDLGGIDAGTGQVVELDRLDLAPGQSYELSFFYANRSPHAPRFHVATNIEPNAGTTVTPMLGSEPHD
jgi:fibro-slime domain-containing protein